MMPDRPMRVTMVNKYYRRRTGGIEAVVRTLSEGLVEHGSQGSSLVSNEGSRGTTECIGGVEVVRLSRHHPVIHPVGGGYAPSLAR